MSTWKNYYLAQSIADAVGALRSSSGLTRVIAGGTDYLLEIQQGHHSPVDTFVDITRIDELRCLEVRNDQLFIGAAVPVRQVSESALVRQHAQAVVEACGLIGGPQVRNAATLGGNVAHALPAADGMIALAAMDAQVEIASAEGLRRAPILTLFAGPGKSTLSGQEMISGFYLSLNRPGQGSAFQRVMRPQGVALPILNLAVWLERDEACIAGIRIAVGPAGPVPQRALAVEEALKGKPFHPQTVDLAEQLLNDSLHFRTSPHRSTAGYRHLISGPLFRQTLQAAWSRAGMASVSAGEEE